MAVLTALSERRWRIAISPRELPAAPGRPAQQAVDVELLDWLQRRLPKALLWTLPLLADTQAVSAQAEAIGIDALLLAGGGDVGTQPRREAIEDRLLARAETQGWPVLGICRGLQRLHVRAGGCLHDLPGHVGAAHALQPGGDQVNSWHRYGFDTAAAGWDVLSRAPDGSVEAMRHQRLRWLGLMWHPERAQGDSAAAEPWLRELFAAAG